MKCDNVGTNNYTFETAENFEVKLFCLLVIDVSPLAGEDIVSRLDKGLKVFQQTIIDDQCASSRIELGVMAFDGTIAMLQEPSLVENINMPTLSELNTSSALIKAANIAIDKVDTRKTWYKETGQTFYRPWIILLTHSDINIGQDFILLANRIKKDTTAKKYHFLPISLVDSNMARLEFLSGFSDNAIQWKISEIEALFQVEIPRQLFHEWWDPEMDIAL